MDAILVAGNDQIYLLTRIDVELRIELENFSGEKRYIIFERFSVSSNDDDFEFTYKNLNYDEPRGTMGKYDSYSIKGKVSLRVCLCTRGSFKSHPIRSKFGMELQNVTEMDLRCVNC
jgi:hypothetical protein